MHIVQWVSALGTTFGALQYIAAAHPRCRLSCDASNDVFMWHEFTAVHGRLSRLDGQMPLVAEADVAQD